MPGYKCAYFYCPVKSRGEGKSLFRFPKNASRTKTWLKAAGREDLEERNATNYKLCEDHFERKFIILNSVGAKRLRDTAVPTIFRCGPQQRMVASGFQVPPTKVLVALSDRHHLYMMAVSIIKSSRGGDLLVVENFSFSKQDVLKSGEVRWRCIKRNSKCSAKLYTVGAELTVTRSDLTHNHEADERSLKRKIVTASCKRKAQEDISEKPSKIIKSVLSTNLPEELISADINLIRRCVYNSRRKVVPTLMPESHEVHAVVDMYSPKITTGPITPVSYAITSVPPDDRILKTIIPPSSCTRTEPAALSSHTPQTENLKPEVNQPKKTNTKPYFKKAEPIARHNWTLEDFNEMCDHFLSNSMSAMVKTHAALRNKEALSQRYTPEFKEFALRLRFLSPPCYRFIRKIFNLPIKRCLQK